MHPMHQVVIGCFQAWIEPACEKQPHSVQLRPYRVFQACKQCPGSIISDHACGLGRGDYEFN
jgi:hypothetical protein